MKKIKVLFLASEAEPLVKVGGLGDVAFSLPHALRSLSETDINGYSIDIRLALPCYPMLTHHCSESSYVCCLEIPSESGMIQAKVYQIEISNLPIYLIQGNPIPPDSTVYSTNSKIDGMKFTFFSLAALELTKTIDWKPDILHANDWHTALSPHAMKYLDEQFFENTKSVLTIHNLPYLGVGAEDALEEFNIPETEDKLLPDWSLRIPLPLGISASDRIIAVSPTYAREILTKPFGSGLHSYLKQNRKKITGILNGLDPVKWDPSTDVDIPANFSRGTLSKRIENKKYLLKEFDLEPDIKKPLLIVISRLDYQKGIDIAIKSLKKNSDIPWNIIILGSGNKDIEEQAKKLQKAMPDRVRTAFRYDAILAKRMYAGGDMLLIPSRYEPCGLTQMIAMLFGCIPVAFATGGLKDTIIAHPHLSSNGFLTQNSTHKSFSSTLRFALETYQNQARWEKMQLNGMNKDFSWIRSAKEYVNNYFQLLGIKRNS